MIPDPLEYCQGINHSVNLLKFKSADIPDLARTVVVLPLKQMLVDQFQDHEVVTFPVLH